MSEEYKLDKQPLGDYDKATNERYGIVRKSNVNENYEGIEIDGVVVSPESFKYTIADTNAYGVTKQATIQDLQEATGHAGYSISPLTLSRYKATESSWGLSKHAPITIIDYDSGDVLTTKHMKKIQDLLDGLESSMKGLGSPIGMIGLFPVNKAPEGWVLADGSHHLKTGLMESLYEYLGASFSVSNTHFKLPDYSGYFLRGYDPFGKVDPDGKNRSWDKEQGDAIRNIIGTINMGASVDSTNGVFSNSGNTREGNKSGRGGGSSILFNASHTIPTSSENRPKNKMVAIYIRAYNTEIIEQNPVAINDLLDSYNDLSKRVKQLEDNQLNKNSFNNSEHGWYTDSNTGFTIQWGWSNRTGNTTRVNFPRPFSKCMNVSISQYTPPTSNSQHNMTVVSFDNTGATYGTHGAEYRFLWTAIGEIK